MDKKNGNVKSVKAIILAAKVLTDIGVNVLVFDLSVLVRNFSSEINLSIKYLFYLFNLFKQWQINYLSI